MSTSLADKFSPAVASPGRIGQGTEVEKARAATEVQGAIYIARQYPRDINAARARMVQACAQPELAESGFWKFPRGKETLTGLTIGVACEIAQCWGNVEYGLTELRRDDVYGQSEMLAFAWDLETNVRNASTFVVPHIRDTKSGGYRLKESRDIYEMTTNHGNRRMRSAIFKILPIWYVSLAERTLRETLRRAVEDKPLSEQIKEVGGDLFNRYGITAAQIEQKLGRPLAQWTPDDVVDMRIMRDSLVRGDLKPEEAFTSMKVTADEVKSKPDPKPEPQPAAAEPEQQEFDWDDQAAVDRRLAAE